MEVICLDEDDEIQQLQRELEELQKERDKYAKELKKRHLKNEIEKLKNENLQLKTKLIENASQAHAEKDNDVKSFVMAEKSIKSPAGSPGSGQDNKNQNKDETGNKRSVGRPRKRPSSPESLPEIEIEPGYMPMSMNFRRVKLLPSQEDKEHASQAQAEKDNDVKSSVVAEKSIKSPAGSPGSGQDNKNQNRDETGNKRSVGRPRKRPSSPESLPEIEIEPGYMSVSMNSKRVKLLPCQEDNKDCKDNEDNCNTLSKNYIWNKNGSPQYLCNLCDFTCEYFLAVYNHLRKEHNKASKAPKDKPGDKSTSFDSGNELLSANLSNRLTTKTRSSTQRRSSDYSVEERQPSSDSTVKQTFDHSHKEMRKSSESAVRHKSEEKQPSSSSAFRRIYDHSREEKRKSDIAVRRTSDISNEERRKSTGSALRQTLEEKQQSSGNAVRQTSEERQKASNRATVVKPEEPKGSKIYTSVAHLFRQTPKGYECVVCRETYHSYIVVYQHVIKYHAQPRFRCKYCAYKVYERHKLIKHCKIEHSGRKLAFIELNEEHQKNKSHTKEDGNSNIINAKAKDTDTGNKDPIDCESDDNNNTDADDESEEKSEDDKSKSEKIVSLKYKILKKTSRGFKCGVCGHQTISYQGIHKHYLINHREKPEAKFKCSYCSYTTNQRRYCIIHIKKAHQAKPIIYRTVDGVQKIHKQAVVSAHQSQQLTIADHISKAAKGFKCTLCGTKTEEYHKMRYHVSYQHFAVFVCPYCEYKSRKRPQVVAHGKRFHPGKPLKITWHVKVTTRKDKLSMNVGNRQENKKKNNSSDETGNKRSVGRPRKRPSSPDVAKESMPEIEPGYMSISMNSRRVKLLPCKEDIKHIKDHLNDEVSIKMEPHDPEQSDIRLLPNVYIDKDELYEFVPQVNEPVTDGPHVEQEMPILSCETLVEEDPVPVSSTTVDVTPDEVDGVKVDVTQDEMDGVRVDVTPDQVDEAREDVVSDKVCMAREYVTPDKVGMAKKDVRPDKVDIARDVTPDDIDMAREDVTPDKVDMARGDVTADEVDMVRKGEEDNPAEKSDTEKENTTEIGELDLDMEVESVEMEHGKKPSDSEHENTEKKKGDGQDSDEIRMCMLIDQNEVWEIRVDELQGQLSVQSELPQAKIKVENEEEEVAGLDNSI
ncbi:hypothetical protein CHS0354_032784 [Potamilus streckersoni]|uniref:C2H2-type domain-containing protein n=1 Tax=Potamilus streckersoni TaxID=2493646 RepID=A0AAE0S9G7_9BIVA|nr:hypothetical protein CHS0354_032784 [Potamilus streckersoni]